MSFFQKGTLTSAVDPGNSQGVFLPVPSLIQLPNISSSEREQTEEEGGRGSGTVTVQCSSSSNNSSLSSVIV